MPTITLNKAMTDTILREARDDLTNRIGEREEARAWGHDTEEPQRRLLAATEVIGGITRQTIGWGAKGCELENANTVEIEFSDEAAHWISDASTSIAPYIDHLDADSTEADPDRQAREVYLAHALARAAGQIEAVPA